MNDFVNMSKEEFNALVQAEVEKLLSSKEESEARKEAEEALKEARETFETLKASIEAKDAKIKGYEEALANLDTDPTAVEVAANEKIVELEGAVADLKRRAEVAEAALETLAREETAAGRMAELEEVGVALEGDAAEVQYAKVRTMSDEDFASYKSELVALKSKYAPSSEEVGEEDAELAALSSEEIGLIAQSLGCDPADSKCISLVSEVAAKMAEVSRSRKKKMAKCSEEKVEASTEEAAPQKETASTKLSFGEAVARATNQEIQASPTMREELAQAWEKLYAEKRGANKSE